MFFKFTNQIDLDMLGPTALQTVTLDYLIVAKSNTNLNNSTN